MKKLTKSLVILAVVVVALVSTTAVFAQGSGPGTSGNQIGSGNSGENRRGDGASLFGDVYGLNDELLHDAYLTAYAEALSLDVVDLEARLDEGETMAEIALATGLTLDEFKTIMVEVRSAVLDQAVADGIITQEQAEKIASRAAAMTRFAGMELGTDVGRGAGRRGSSQGMPDSSQGLHDGDCISD